MFKNIIRSIKKSKKSESHLHLNESPKSKLSFTPDNKYTFNQKINDENENPTPLLKWSASLDDLFKLCNENDILKPDTSSDQNDACVRYSPLGNHTENTYNKALTDIKQRQKIANDRGLRRSLDTIFASHNVPNDKITILEDIVESENKVELLYLDLQEGVVLQGNKAHIDGNESHTDYDDQPSDMHNVTYKAHGEIQNMSKTMDSPQFYLSSTFLNDSSCTYVSYFQNNQGIRNIPANLNFLKTPSKISSLEKLNESVTPTSTHELMQNVNLLPLTKSTDTITKSLSPSSMASKESISDDDSGTKVSRNISFSPRQTRLLLAAKDQHISHLENQIRLLEINAKESRDPLGTQVSLFDAISNLGNKGVEIVHICIPNSDLNTGMLQFMLGRDDNDRVVVKRAEAGSPLLKGDMFLEINGSLACLDSEAEILNKLNGSEANASAKCVIIRNGINEELLGTKEDLSLALLELDEVQNRESIALQKINVLKSDIYKLAESFDELLSNLGGTEQHEGVAGCLDNIKKEFSSILSLHFEDIENSYDEDSINNEALSD